MTYRVARSGQTFGPYTEAEIRQYIASGNIGLSDLVQGESSGDWVSVAQLFPAHAAPYQPTPLPVRPLRVYPDPPDFPWWGALLLGLASGGLFLVVWDIVQASWLKRAEQRSSAFLLYIGVAILYFFRMPGIFTAENFSLHHHGGGLDSLWLILLIVARFVFRRELLDHFNEREAIPLRLSKFLTFVLGGVYFQYHFNRVNVWKRSTNRSVPAV